MDDSLEDRNLIPTHDQRLRVFVSSSMNELAEERRAVQRAISALRLTPVLFELGARPHPPRDVYRAYLEQSDIFIGLYWQQYGRVSPGTEVSGLEDEFELSGRLPRLMYVKVPAPEREPRLADLLKRIGREVSYRVFRTARELNRLVRDDLAALLSERFGASRVPSLASLPTLAAAAPRTVPPRLPVGTTSLIGRESDLAALAQLVDRERTRLVTLTGPGGVGKTRLAMAAGDHLRRHFADGTVFVPLAPVTQPERVLTAIALAVGADLAGAGSPLEALIEHFGDGRWLLILDNLEQVTTVASDLDTMLERCRGLMILTTSRTVLGLRAEWEYSVAPLSFAADVTTTPLADLALLPAVALFLDRARAVHPGFSLTEDNAAAVVEMCRRLEGLPLAIELAAARTRLLQPDALLKRLSASLDVLGTGGPDMPERQRTLRATVEWSIGLLDDAERSLLEISAVFVGGWTLPAAAHVAALAEERTLEVSEALARHSLIEFADSVGGPRGRMLQTIREFVSERLAARSDATEVEQRHAEFYREMAEQTDRYLRGGRQDEWLERLAVESGNLAAAVRWYLDHDLAQLPHLFRAMWPLWFLRDIMGDGRSWLEQLLPCAESFDPEARAELMWSALVAALEVGDDEAALAARQQLEPLLPGIRDRFLQAAAQLAAAWSLPITGDNGAALHAASGSLEEFRRQDEPFWTALALGSIGNLEITAGNQDRALTHLREAVEVSDRFGSAFLSTFSRTLLSALLIKHGRLDEAGALLQDALNVSLTAGSTRSVTLSLSGFARLAIAEGDLQRAALLAGAAEGLRRRAGLRAWPMMRAAEAELVAQGRQTLEPGQFDEMFADGTQLSSQEAVDVIHDDFVESQAS